MASLCGVLLETGLQIVESRNYIMLGLLKMGSFMELNICTINIIIHVHIGRLISHKPINMSRKGLHYIKTYKNDLMSNPAISSTIVT